MKQIFPSLTHLPYQNLKQYLRDSVIQFVPKILCWNVQ